jgi:hypothetical protein
MEFYTMSHDLVFGSFEFYGTGLQWVNRKAIQPVASLPWRGGAEDMLHDAFMGAAIISANVWHFEKTHQVGRKLTRLVLLALLWAVAALGLGCRFAWACWQSRDRFVVGYNARRDVVAAECEASAIALLTSEFEVIPDVTIPDLWEILQVDAVIDVIATAVTPTPVLAPVAVAGYLPPVKAEAPSVEVVAPKAKTRRGSRGKATTKPASTKATSAKPRTSKAKV